MLASERGHSVLLGPQPTVRIGAATAVVVAVAELIVLGSEPEYKVLNIGYFDN